MMKKIPFSLSGIDSLSDLLKLGIQGFAINSHYGLTTTICLFLYNDLIITIQSTMNELGGWEEIGTLVFTANINHTDVPAMIPLSPVWNEIRSVEKLQIEENEFSADCGIVIKNGLGEKMIITCGAEVYSVQMQAPFFEGKFNPEYDFVRYKLETLTD
jgi:hypothetical protein